MKVPLLTKKQWHKDSCISESTELSGRHRCRCQKYVRTIRKTSLILQIYSSSFLTRQSISTAKILKRALALRVNRDNHVWKLSNKFGQIFN